MEHSRMSVCISFCLSVCGNPRYHGWQTPPTQWGTLLRGKQRKSSQRLAEEKRKAAAETTRRERNQRNTNGIYDWSKGDSREKSYIRALVWEDEAVKSSSSKPRTRESYSRNTVKCCAITKGPSLGTNLIYLYKTINNHCWSHRICLFFFSKIRLKWPK